MKKKILFLSIVVILIAALGTGTLAYFSAEGTAHNVITTGGVGILIVEKTEKADGTLVDFPEDGLTGIMPGSAASKIVKVENTGHDEAWIRVQVEQSILSKDNRELPLALKGNIPVMSYTVDGENWTEKDGWYYCNAPVLPGEATAVLFEEVRFAPEMGNAYQGCTANLFILAQAVQTANNGEAVLEAQGWPVEVTD